MTTLSFTYILMISVAVAESTSIVRTWKFNTNFNNTNNWDKREIPCKTSAVVFPANMEVPVELPTATQAGSVLEIRKLVLSRQGVLIFPASDGGLALSSEKRHASCSGGDDHFMRTGSKRWADPDNWEGPSSEINLATPHLERIPCKWHDVLFPMDASFYITLPSRPISVSRITMQGIVFKFQSHWSAFLISLGWRFFPGVLEADPGSFQVTGDQCQDTSGCECGNYHVYEDVCTGKWKWQEAQCADPVVPVGFCFPICGAFLLYKGNSMNILDIRGSVKSFAEGKTLVSHTSKANGFIQIVLVDKNEYSGTIDEAAKELHRVLLNRGLVNELSSSVQYSGLEINTVHASEIFSRFLLGFLCSLIGFAVVFCSYEEKWFAKSLPWGRTRTKWAGVDYKTSRFARFENASGRVEIGNEAVPTELTRHQPAFSEQLGFDNPMFSENLQSSDGMALSEFDGRRGSLITVDTDIVSLEGSDSASGDELSMKEVHLEPVNL